MKNKIGEGTTKKKSLSFKSILTISGDYEEEEDDEDIPS